MYIITTNGLSNIYHLAVRTNASKETYATVCGYYYNVQASGRRIMLVDTVSDDRRRCKRCETLAVKVTP